MNKLCEVRTISHIRMQVYNVQAVIHAHTAKTHPNMNQVCFFLLIYRDTSIQCGI